MNLLLDWKTHVKKFGGVSLIPSRCTAFVADPALACVAGTVKFVAVDRFSIEEQCV
jgi:hypothetical protein